MSSKRQSDILRLFSHIQYINQNDTKLLEDLFFEIEKLSQLNSMSEQEMRDIAVLKLVVQFLQIQITEIKITMK